MGLSFYKDIKMVNCKPKILILMNSIKQIFLAIFLSFILFSCDDNNNRGFVNPFADVDHEELAISDNDSIVSFLKNHYYDSNIDSVRAITSGNTSMFSDGKLETINVKQNDIDYKLYAYVIKQGEPNQDKGLPSNVDSVFVKYSGQLIRNTTSLGGTFDSNTSGIWFSLTTVIRGWSHGFTIFKGGELKKEANGEPFNGPITFLNSGRGVLFIPSGLAYPSSDLNNLSNGLVNQNLMFYINLLDFVKDTDHDNDNVPSRLEDIDGDGDPRNDDTDGDLVSNLVDRDDDNDGVLTKDEDKNGDGNPANDFNDPNNPNLPDYLNPDIK